uniref:Uncharacterized protein n=1 Tax=Trichogramma kaykai TaxID=54128 RepID=A0ABD2VTH6_9HYME
MRRQQTTATLLESERAKEREADGEREEPRLLQASHALDRSRDPPPPSAVPYPARVDTKRTRREKSSCYRAEKFESATSSSHNMPPPPPPLLLLCDRYQVRRSRATTTATTTTTTTGTTAATSTFSAELLPGSAGNFYMCLLRARPSHRRLASIRVPSAAKPPRLLNRARVTTRREGFRAPMFPADVRYSLYKRLMCYSVAIAARYISI